MALAPVTFAIKTAKRDKLMVEIDRHGWERLADSLGFFREEFLESLEQAEADIALGRVKKLHQLGELKKK
jgi:hypothetical protein